MAKTILDEFNSTIVSNSSRNSIQRDNQCGQALETMHECGMDVNGKLRYI